MNSSPSPKPVAPLEYRKDWEADIYTVRGAHLQALREVQIDGVRYAVVTRQIRAPYNDMGHTYEAVSNHYYVRVKVLGVEMEIDLNRLVGQAPVLATDYTERP